MRRDLLLIEEMIAAAERAADLVQGITVDDLTGDQMRRDALLWNLAVVGEASTQVSDAVKAQYPEVPWRQPARLRNRIVHGYWSIDLGIVHTTAEQQLPAFAAQLRSVLDGLRSDDDQGVADPDLSAP